MRVLVSGSHGLIGAELTRRLVRRGDEVVALVRSPGATLRAGRTAASGESPALDDRGPVTVGWNPPEHAVAEEDLDRVGPIGAVVNLAGAGIGDRRWSPRRREEIRESRVRSTQVLARTLPRMGNPAVWVNASAVGFYGDRGDEVLTEEAEGGRGFLAEVCRAWEDAARPVAEAGCRLVLLRSGIVLSASGGALGRQLPLFKAGLGARLGDGRQWISWITLDDEVGAILEALDSDRLQGPVNATSPHPVTNAGFAAALGRALHRPVVLHVPTAALGWILGRQMASELLLSSQRAQPVRLERAGYRFAHTEIDGALHDVLQAPGSRVDHG